MISKLLVGLGNPGEKYEKTRHNVGFMMLDSFVEQIPNPKSQFKNNKKLQSEILKIDNIILAKPQTFMNNSGIAVKSLSTFYRIPTQNIWVIHDDLDIHLGEFKIQKGVGPKLHYGIGSIEEKLGSKDFWRVRVGIDNRKVEQVDQVEQVLQERKISGEKYVLQDFGSDEIEMRDGVIKEVIGELKKRLF